MTIIRNERLQLGAKRRPLKPVPYTLVDSNNVRIGTKWFKYTQKVTWENGVMKIIHGVTITDGTMKRFIANSWYEDIDIVKL